MPINPHARKSTEKESSPDYQKEDSGQTLVWNGFRTEPVCDGFVRKGCEYRRSTENQKKE